MRGYGTRASECDITRLTSFLSLALAAIFLPNGVRVHVYLRILGTTTMSFLNSRLTTVALRSSLHRGLSARPLSTSPRPPKTPFSFNVFHKFRSNPLCARLSTRGIATEVPVVGRPTQADAWKRYAITAVRISHPRRSLVASDLFNTVQATVGGTVFAVQAFFNRNTRDALSAGEKDYLHEAFQYTGGGLALTALAARGLFKSGAAVRIMAANPCEFSARFMDAGWIHFAVQGSCWVSVWCEYRHIGRISQHHLRSDVLRPVEA